MNSDLRQEVEAIWVESVKETRSRGDGPVVQHLGPQIYPGSSWLTSPSLHTAVCVW